PVFPNGRAAGSGKSCARQSRRSASTFASYEAPLSNLSLRQLVKRYGAVSVVKNVSLEIAEGEFVSLLGPSGCGKTTILRMVAGLVEPSDGAITIGGRDITRLPPNKRNVGLVFQSYALFPHMTVFENVAFGL